MPVNRQDPESSTRPSEKLMNAFVWLYGGVLIFLTLSASIFFLDSFFEFGRSSSDSSGGTLAAITLFGVLISGVFIFMTFRIDRGAKTEAREEANRIAKLISTEIAERGAASAKEEAEAIARQVAKDVASKNARKVANETVREMLDAATKSAEAVATQAAKETANEIIEEVRQKLRDRVDKIASVVDEIRKDTPEID